MVDKKTNHLAFTYIGDCPVYVSRKNVKNYNFRIYAHCVKVSVPKAKTDEEIKEVIDKNKSRLISKIIKLQKNITNPTNEQVPDVISSILYLGKKRPIKYTDVKKPEYKDGEFLLPKDYKYEDYYTVEEKIYSLLKELLRQIIKEELEKWGEKTGLEYSRFSIRKMKRIWASITVDKATMRFNFYLVTQPREAISSVVIHELTHLKEFDHSKRFYDLLYSYMPNYEEAHKVLKTISTPVQYIF